MTSPESVFLRDFFKVLAEKNIVYVVAREWDSLPDSLDGSDLDILVGNDADMHATARIALEVAKKNNGHLLSRVLVEMYALSFGGRLPDGSWWGLHIDISVGNKYHGFFYYDPAMVMASRQLDTRGFYTNGSDVGVIAFFKELMANGADRKGYYALARSEYAHDADRVKKAMQPCFDVSGMRLVESILSHELSAEELMAVHRKVYFSLMRRYIKGRGFFRFLALKFANYFKRGRRVFSPPGYFVAFLGTDGSGKSTVIDSIKKPIYRMLHFDIAYHHLRPGLLPSLSKLAGRPQHEGPTTAPHAGKVAGRVSSLIRFSYYLVDYTLGYWLRIHSVISKYGLLVVNDRYYYEYYLDQRRLIVCVPMWIVRFARLFIPEPNLIICLTGDPELIYARKSETSLETVEAQVAKINDFAAHESRAVLVSTTQALKATVDQVLEAIVKGMGERYHAV